MQAWKPHLEADIDKVESIQRRATRITTGFGKLEYEERLKRLGLTTLKDRRLIGDLIKMYKVISSRESIVWVKPINLRRKVDKSGPAVNVRKNSQCAAKKQLQSWHFEVI